ncbi:HlyD family efflux transporter periplasmic adaptor subunit [Noviherbaspirillum sp. 1P10PC]|uniref:efflux RND transporter periplasmic adaptor subunit n=1 Tax=Noviherbaspirillum sp. 1P10PC TaxID=3132292 RepID=UPI0039A01328
MSHREIGMPAIDEALLGLLDMARRLRGAQSLRELEFMLVNDSRNLLPYRQAALWLAPHGLRALSGIVQIEANAPYAQWVEQVCRHLAAGERADAQAFTAADLPPALAAQWSDWWPAHALWLPLPGRGEPAAAATNDAPPAAGLLLVRDDAWTTAEQALLREWGDVAAHALHALHQPRAGSLHALRTRLRALVARRAGRAWWLQPALLWCLLAAGVLLFPVRMTVLAPGELTPANPVTIRAPLDGVVDVFHVQPNQLVKKDQPLFGFDEALIKSRADVAAQALATADTEYRQASQQALVDSKSRQQLATLAGKIEEKRAEVAFLREQLGRARVLAPRDGVVMFDDPSEWIGRPVTVGERIMRLAAPADSEVEAWLPLADAIALPDRAEVDLYLSASPLAPVAARVRYFAHDAVQRPDGSYAYRIRAALDAPTPHRVGMKGTAKLHGERVPLAFWILRRPLAALRAAIGF